MNEICLHLYTTTANEWYMVTFIIQQVQEDECKCGIYNYIQYSIVGV